jgi:hypothetical protein
MWNNNFKERERNPMIRIDLTWVLKNIEGLNFLSKLNLETKASEAWFPLEIAKNSLTGMITHSIYSSHFRVSRDQANKLLLTLDKLLLRSTNEPVDFQISEYELWDLNEEKSKFETILFSEMSILPIYLATPKDAYDIEKLTNNGDTLFPPAMLLKVPEARVDAMEAGKCLAFELNTACGFHTFRVVEAVLRKYWDAVAEGKSRPEPTTLGTMAGQLEICNLGDVKVSEALKQLTKLHRNPISHPDVVLNGDAACAIIGMARSVITHMLLVLQDAPLTTGAVSPLE